MIGAVLNYSVVVCKHNNRNEYIGSVMNIKADFSKILRCN